MTAKANNQAQSNTDQQSAVSSTELDNNNVKRSHDLFSDPALSKSLEEDPVARFILNNWKNLLIAILAVVGAFYLRTQIKSTTEVRVAESSETFDKARSALMELVEMQQKAASATPGANTEAADKEKSDKLIRAVKDSFSALKSGPEPYTLLVPLYEQVLKKYEAQTAATVDSKQSSLEPIAWKEASAATNRLLLEMQELSNARTLLDSEQSVAQGILKLKELASSAEYVRASAALSLLRVVESEADKKMAISIGQDVAKMYPEQADKIETELKRLL